MSDEKFVYYPAGELELFNGVAWVASILTEDGRSVCEVQNRGEGGVNDYRVLNDDLWEHLNDVAQQQNPNAVEPLDTFIHDLWIEDAGISA